MAYKQEPGRGPTATFKNLTNKGLIGPTANGEDTKKNVDPSTGFKKGITGDVGVSVVEKRKDPSWTDYYTSKTYVTKGGKSITKFTPMENVVGGRPKYYESSKKNPDASMTEINKSQFTNLLSRGDKATNQKYKLMTEQDVATGGDLATLKELKGE